MKVDDEIVELKEWPDASARRRRDDGVDADDLDDGDCGNATDALVRVAFVTWSRPTIRSKSRPARRPASATASDVTLARRETGGRFSGRRLVRSFTEASTASR
jgi:hypothetical protein